MAGVLSRIWADQGPGRWAAPWLLAPHIGKFYSAIGVMLDIEAQRVLEGRLAAIPYAGAEPNAARLANGQRIECNPDALPWHFRDRSLKDYATLATIGKRFLLSRWHQLHAQRGTHRGELGHVRPYFLNIAAPPSLLIVHQAGDGSSATWHMVDSAGTYSVNRHTPSNFDFDGNAAEWSRWFAFIKMSGTGIAPPPKYGDGHYYGDGTLYGVGSPGGLSVAAQADLVSMFLDWQGAHSKCIGIAIDWVDAIDPTVDPSQDADGRWLLPNGANTWAGLVDPTTGKATRPAGVQWIYDNP